MNGTRFKEIPKLSEDEISSVLAKTRESELGCWDWIGYRDPDGYGVIKVRHVPYRAHRLFYSQFVGELVPGMVIDHLCRNVRCVKPVHLEQVTVRVNTLRGVSPVARNRDATMCPQGHEYSGRNLYVDPTGRRHCRTCSVERTREWRRMRQLRIAIDDAETAQVGELTA